MAHPQFANQSAFAIPRKIRAEFRKWHLFVGELSKSGMSDHVRSKLIGAQFYSAGNFEQRWRLKLYIHQRFTDASRIEESFQINRAVNLEFRGVAFSIPIAATRKSAFAVVPFTMRNV